MTQRKIKFRIWVKEDKNMIYQCDFDNYEITLEGNIHFYQNCHDGEFGDDFIKIGKQIELMQFTGLLDKNDKEIYEGDILEFDYEPLGKFREEIKFVDSGFWIKRKDGSNFLPSKEYREIIGNVMENPELLKEEKIKLKGEI